MTRRSVLLAVSLIVASVGCSTRPQEPKEQSVLDTATSHQQTTVAASPQLTEPAPPPFVLPQHIARCIAKELVVTTYLRGGPDRLTIDVDIVVEPGQLENLGPMLEYGIGMPLLQWTYDGRTLRKADAWRALVAQVACDPDDLQELLVTYCVWDKIGDVAPGTLGDCVHHLDGWRGTDTNYLRALRRAQTSAAHILDSNRATIDAVVARLSQPREGEMISVMNDVGRAPTNDCGIPQWQFGWYAELLKEYPLSYAPVPGTTPGTYPLAIDDGACPVSRKIPGHQFTALVRLSDQTLYDVQDVFGYPFLHFSQSREHPRLNHFLTIQFDPNDFRAISQIDAVVSRRLRAAQTAQ